MATTTSQLQWHRRRLTESAPPEGIERLVLADRFLIGQEDVRRVINIADVDWVESEGNYARFHVANEGHRLRVTMHRVIEALAPHAFVRIHRGVIVNARRIVAIRDWSSKDPIIDLVDGTTLRASRNYVDALNDAFAHPLTQREPVAPNKREPNVTSFVSARLRGG